MVIRITGGTGEGPTPLAAFDAALLSAGVANCNLLFLSSVIPPGATVERTKFTAPLNEYGHRLYAVAARRQAARTGEEAWAGLGWTQEPSDGRGLFVECHGESEESVRRDIQATLAAMVASRPASYGPIDCEVVGVGCDGQPVCALVIAVYRSAAWD